jgi:heat shock protein HslJ
MKIPYPIPVVLIAILSACSPGGAELTAQATPEPVQEAVPEPILTESSWMWVSLTDPTQQVQVEDPENYLLSFQEDGSLVIKADCNQAIADYTFNDSSLSIQVGPMTRAMCPEGSRSDQFVELLNTSAIYFFEEGHLFIDLMADGGTLEFVATDLEAEQAPVTEETETIILFETAWQWVAFTDPLQQFQVEDPAKYQLTFNPDNSLNIKADCNLAQGKYTLEDQSISIQIGPTTLAACPEGSRSEQLLKLLPYAAIIFFQDGDLFIDLMADGGTLQLKALP